MRHLMRVLAMAASFSMTQPANADCGDQLFKLLADDGAMRDFFGAAVAISGATAIVGAVGDDDNGAGSGSAYLFDTKTGAQIAKLLADDGRAEDEFGRAVAINGDTAIVGAWFDDDNGTDSGAAYLFDITTGEQIVKLLPDDGSAVDVFGNSVAIGGTTAVIGANGDDDKGTQSGSAYVFDTTTGRQIAKLLAKDGAAWDNFGVTVAVEGAIAIVGAWLDDDNGSDSGSAYLFDTTTGEQIAKLLAEDGAAGDRFGRSVAISGATAVVGADYADEKGAAYLFDTTTGRQIAKLVAEDGEPGDSFGAAVAISGETAIVGAWGDDDNGDLSGSAYLFDTMTGRQVAKLLAEDGAWPDHLGFSVAISADIAIAGAFFDGDDGFASGSAYLFDAADCGGCVRDPQWLCDGDVDGDGQVNPVDAGLVQAAFGSSDDQILCNYDLDCDGQINPVDAGIVQSLFGTCDLPREVCP